MHEAQALQIALQQLDRAMRAPVRKPDLDDLLQALDRAIGAFPNERELDFGLTSLKFGYRMLEEGITALERRQADEGSVGDELRAKERRP